ncbi:hypothetical protein BGZ94_008462 [Podila epigama]|nr:hypothetical protein BGZ94_008462 [Podila epigama]
MILPQTQGSIYLYQAFVDPYLTQHEREIDQTLLRLKSQAMAMGMQYAKQALQLLQNLILDLYKKSLGQSELSVQNVQDSQDQPTHESSSSQARTINNTNTHGQGTEQESKGYLAWAINAVSPKLTAVATMASQSISRQIPPRPLPKPPVNLYGTVKKTSSSSSQGGMKGTDHGADAFGISSAANGPDRFEADGFGDSVDKSLYEQLTSRLNKAAQSTGAHPSGATASARHRKISLYEDDNEDASYTPRGAEHQSSASGHAKDTSWGGYATGFERHSSSLDH